MWQPNRKRIRQCRYLQILEYQLWRNNSGPLIKTHFFSFTPIRCQNSSTFIGMPIITILKVVFDRYYFLIADAHILDDQYKTTQALAFSTLSK